MLKTAIYLNRALRKRNEWLNLIPPPPNPLDGDSSAENIHAKSFKETHLGNKMVNDEWLEDSIDDESEIQIDQSIPVVRSPKELKKWIRVVWRNTLIVKLVGKFFFNFTQMIKNLQYAWHTSEFDAIYLGNGFFGCNFESQVESHRLFY